MSPGIERNIWVGRKELAKTSALGSKEIWLWGNEMDKTYSWDGLKIG